MADGDDLFFPVIVKKGAKIIRPKTFTKCRRGVADLVSKIEDLHTEDPIAEVCVYGKEGKSGTIATLATPVSVI